MYMLSYLYFMFKDPDALRSENYSLEKLAIQRGLAGDSTSGPHEREIGTESERRFISSSIRSHRNTNIHNNPADNNDS